MIFSKRKKALEGNNVYAAVQPGSSRAEAVIEHLSSPPSITVPAGVARLPTRHACKKCPTTKGKARTGKSSCGHVFFSPTLPPSYNRKEIHNDEHLGKVSTSLA